jgi:hypothetical protein
MRNALRLLLASAFFIACVSADTVTISTGTFDPFPTLTALNDPNSGQNGSLAFWANHSVDGLTNPSAPPGAGNPPAQVSQLNVGNFITGTCGPSNATVGSCPAGAFDGQATPNMNPSNLGYYADGSDPISSFYFTRDSTPDVLNPDLIFTANIVELGWYNITTPTVHNTIYTNLTENQGLPPGFSLANIPLGTNYGLYVVVDYGSGYLASYYTQSEMNTFTSPPASQSFSSVLGTDTLDGINKEHFALFQSGTTGVIGLEDGLGTAGYEGMGDYQDAVLSISLATPEPATVGLAGLGLLAAFFLRRRLAVRS